MCGNGAVRKGRFISGEFSFFSGSLLRGGSGAPKKCCASTEPPSSIGVKILRDLAFDDKCLICGGLICSGCRNSCAGGGETRVVGRGCTCSFCVGGVGFRCSGMNCG